MTEDKGKLLKAETKLKDSSRHGRREEETEERLLENNPRQVKQKQK